MGKPKNLAAGYFVRMREYERKLILEAIECAEGDRALAAEMLGVDEYYITARALFLGGVFVGDPKNEPPKKGAIREAWDKSGRVEGANWRRPRKSRTTTVTLASGRTLVARDRARVGFGLEDTGSNHRTRKKKSQETKPPHA